MFVHFSVPIPVRKVFGAPTLFFNIGKALFKGMNISEEKCTKSLNRQCFLLVFTVLQFFGSQYGEIKSQTGRIFRPLYSIVCNFIDYNCKL